jgi:hypothetical protein
MDGSGGRWVPTQTCLCSPPTTRISRGRANRTLSARRKPWKWQAARRIAAPIKFASGCCSSCVSPSRTTRRMKRRRWPWPMKSTPSGFGGGRRRRISLAEQASRSARRSPRRPGAGGRPFSRSTSHASTTFDCGEPSRQRSSSSKDRRLPPRRPRGTIYGRDCAGDRPLRHRRLFIEAERRDLPQRDPGSRGPAWAARHFGPGPRM